MSRFWETLVSAQRARSALNKSNAEACDSMRETEEKTATTIAESRELMREVDAILARGVWNKP